MQKNIFELFARLRREARRAGWSDSEIRDVIEDAKEGDYTHAWLTVMGALDEIQEEALQRA